MRIVVKKKDIKRIALRAFSGINRIDQEFFKRQDMQHYRIASSESSVL